MTIPLSTIKTTLQAWCVTASGLSDSNVIFAHQNAPEPTGTFIVITPTLLVVKRGLIDEHRWNSDGTIQTYQVRDCIAQIDCYGVGAVEYISAIQDYIDRPDTYQTFRAQELAIRANSDLRFLPEQKGQRWEDRANIDLRIRSTQTQDSGIDLGYFQTIKYDGDAGDAFIDRITTQTIEE